MTTSESGNQTSYQPRAVRFRATTIRAGLLLLAVGLGAGLSSVMTMPGAQAWLWFGLVGGLLGLSVWVALRLPVAPLLRGALVAGFFFKSEFDVIKLDRMHSPSGFNLSLSLLAAVLLLPHWFFRERRQVRAAIFPWAFALTLGGLWLWCAFAVGAGASGLSGLASLWALAGSMLVCWVVVAQCNTPDRLRQAALCLALAIGLNSLLGLGQNWFEPLNHLTALGAALEEDRPKVGDGEIARFSGLMRNPTALARSIATWSPVFLALLLAPCAALRRWERGLVVAAAVLALPALILTYARGGWAAFAIALLLLTVFAYRALPRLERRRFVPKLSWAGVVLLLLCLPFAQPMYVRLTEDDRGSAYARVATVEVATALIKDNPWLGTGLNSYYEAARRYDRTPDLISDELFAVHNFYFHIAAETGVPGLLFFLLLNLLAGWQGWRAMQGPDPLLRALALGLLCGQAAFLVTGLKEPGTFGSWLLQDIFLLFGLLLAVARVNPVAPPVHLRNVVARG